MSATCCPLTEADGECEFSSVDNPVARKGHCCCECVGAISPGEKYQRNVGKSDGDMWSMATCHLCAEIRNHFSCGGGYFLGTLWDDLRENFFPKMVAGGPCLEGLSAAAKERMFAAWREWKGLR